MKKSMTRWTVVPQNNIGSYYPLDNRAAAANMAADMAYVENQNYMKGVNDALQLTTNNNYKLTEDEVTALLKSESILYIIIGIVIVAILIFMKVY
jgi:hypothetical protein